MKLRNFFKNIMTFSLLAGSIAQANPLHSDGYPGRGGGHRHPGDGHRPGHSGPRDPDCHNYRGGYRDPRCDQGHHGRGDRWEDRRGPRHRPPHRPPQYPPQYPPHNPPPVYNPPPSYGESSIIFNAVVPRPGGEWLRVHILQPIRLDYVQVQPLNGAVALHEAVLLTRSGARYYIHSLSQTGIFNGMRSSEHLNVYDQVVAVDIRAESMGYGANLLVRILGSHHTNLSGTRF